MKNGYVKYAKELIANKRYSDLNYFIINNVREIITGKFKVSKAIAKRLTIPTIIDLGCNCKECLKFIPDYGTNDFRAMLIDWILDMKLDREYKKPSMKELFTAFPRFVSHNLGMSCVLLMEHVGITKEEYIKSFNIDKYTWLNLLNCLHGGSIKITDTDLRQLDRKHMKKYKYHDTSLLMKLSKWNRSEITQLLKDNYDGYAARRFVARNMSKIDDGALLFHLFKNHSSYEQHRYAYNPELKNLITRLAKNPDIKVGTIAKALYPEADWLHEELKNKPELFNEDLDIVLQLLPDSHKAKAIIEAYNYTFEDLVNYNIK